MKKILFIWSVALAFASCAHKELCYDHTHTVDVQVAFDWTNDPGAAPASMSLYLFPADGGEALRYEFTDRTGGRIVVPIGRYDALCLNSDTEAILYRNTERLETFEVYTRDAALLESLGVRSEGAPRAEGTENQRVALAPDMLWIGRSNAIVLAQSDAQKTITLAPEASVCVYTVEIRNASNLKYVTGVSGSLAGMAGGLLPGRNELTAEHVIIPFEAAVSEDKTTLTGRFLAFGHCPVVQEKHPLMVYAVLADGSKNYYSYDVTEQLHTASDPTHVHFVLDSLPLPKPIVNGGGFQPSVGGWQSVDVAVDM